MGARSKARKRALDLLFEADSKDVNPVELLRDRLARPVTPAPLPEYTADLVSGVVEHWGEINDVLGDYSQGWSLDRMPDVDRSILRVGVFEIVWQDDVPDAVAISEAVQLAKELSTDESPAFVNGLLGRVAEVKETLV